jgi:hypothetical protein
MSSRDFGTASSKRAHRRIVAPLSLARLLNEPKVTSPRERHGAGAGSGATSEPP